MNDNTTERSYESLVREVKKIRERRLRSVYGYHGGVSEEFPYISAEEAEAEIDRLNAEYVASKTEEK